MSDDWLGLGEMPVQPGSKGARFFSHQSQSYGPLFVDDRFVSGVGVFGTSGIGTHPSWASLVAELGTYGVSTTSDAAELDRAVEELGGFQFVGVQTAGTPSMGLMTLDGTMVLPARSADYSPDGPNWSYVGAGPNQASQSLLGTATGQLPEQDAVNAFTDGVVSKLPDEWAIPVGDVADWAKGGGSPRIIALEPGGRFEGAHFMLKSLADRDGDAMLPERSAGSVLEM